MEIETAIIIGIVSGIVSAFILLEAEKITSWLFEKYKMSRAWELFLIALITIILLLVYLLIFVWIREV